MAEKKFTGVAARMTPRRGRDLTLSCAAIAAILLFTHFAMQGFILDAYLVRILNMCATYAILGLSMNLVNGFTGLFSLGQAGFMAVGAYVTTILFLSPEAKGALFYLKPMEPFLQAIQLPFWLSLLVAGLVSALAAFLIGFPCLRLRGDYLAIATLGFSEIIRVLFTNMQTVTNGAVGLKGIPPVVNLWWSFGIMALVIVFIRRLMRTSYGRAFKAIRDDEVAAESMGISLFKHKMMSFVLSGFIAGLGGGLIASIVGSINPLQFRFILSYDILMIVVLGGMGSVSGTVVAAFLITAAKEWLRWLDNGFSLGLFRVPAIAGMRMVVFSVLLMLVILFYRQGLSGGKEFSWQALIDFLGKPARRDLKREEGGKKT
ncbi:MAG: branched-chain amino acid ABC transporter permease [Firmicutes bacterium]|nr:branched-chain amino acid ABC transporter permease [Bacillota bacterium]